MIKRFGLGREGGESEQTLQETSAVDEMGGDNAQGGQKPCEWIENLNRRRRHCHKVEKNGGNVKEHQGRVEKSDEGPEDESEQEEGGDHVADA